MRIVEIALGYNGLLALCLSMPKHYRQLLGDRPADAVRWVFKIIGWSAVVVSFFASVGESGWSFGPVEWIGMIGMMGLVLILLWPRPQVAAFLSGLLLILAIVNIASSAS